MFADNEDADSTSLLLDRRATGTLFVYATPQAINLQPGRRMQPHDPHMTACYQTLGIPNQK